MTPLSRRVVSSRGRVCQHSLAARCQSEIDAGINLSAIVLLASVLSYLRGAPAFLGARMGEFAEFLRPADVFDPEVLKTLGKAYDMALAALHDIGQPEVVREVLARRIIRAAKKGECDAAKLCAVALSAFNDDRLMR